jgi:xanthosine utilization system XapX-like protein
VGELSILYALNIVVGAIAMIVALFIFILFRDQSPWPALILTVLGLINIVLGLKVFSIDRSVDY